jgi:hypothetical protein
MTTLTPLPVGRFKLITLVRWFEQVTRFNRPLYRWYEVENCGTG